MGWILITLANRSSRPQIHELYKGWEEADKRYEIAAYKGLSLDTDKYLPPLGKRLASLPTALRYKIEENLGGKRTKRNRRRKQKQKQKRTNKKNRTTKYR